MRIDSTTKVWPQLLLLPLLMAAAQQQPNTITMPVPPVEAPSSLSDKSLYLEACDLLDGPSDQNGSAPLMPNCNSPANFSIGVGIDEAVGRLLLFVS